VQSVRRFGSVCSGAFILAELGELNGIRVATHWATCDELARRFPTLRVDANALFVASGRAWTSAGVSTGIDMALAMVEQDVGAMVADRVARFLVLHARRPGYQSQFSELLSIQAAAGPRFAELMAWVEERLSKQIDVASMASQAGMSERTFYRRFLAATGQTPAQFVENARLDRVRTLLATNRPLKTIAAQCGMSSLARMNSAFKRKFGLSPGAFRYLQGRATSPEKMGRIGAGAGGALPTSAHSGTRT
jgi:transcriptional regulator GlxA family with amidase domain